jgi:hypothetical protein
MMAKTKVFEDKNKKKAVLLIIFACFLKKNGWL